MDGVIAADCWHFSEMVLLYKLTLYCDILSVPYMPTMHMQMAGDNDTVLKHSSKINIAPLDNNLYKRGLL